MGQRTGRIWVQEMNMEGGFVKIPKTYAKRMQEELTAQEFKLLSGILACVWTIPKMITIEIKGEKVSKRIPEGSCVWSSSQASKLFRIQRTFLPRLLRRLQEKGFIEIMDGVLGENSFTVVRITIPEEGHTLESETMYLPDTPQAETMYLPDTNNVSPRYIPDPTMYLPDTNNVSPRYILSSQPEVPQEVTYAQELLRIATVKNRKNSTPEHPEAAARFAGEQGGQPSEFTDKEHTLKSDALAFFPDLLPIPVGKKINVFQHLLSLKSDPLIEVFLFRGEIENGVFVPREPDATERTETLEHHLLPIQCVDTRMYFRKSLRGDYLSQDLTPQSVPLSIVLQLPEVQRTPGITRDFREYLLQTFAQEIVFYPSNNSQDASSSSQSIHTGSTPISPSLPSVARRNFLTDKALFSDPPRYHYAAANHE